MGKKDKNDKILIILKLIYRKKTNEKDKIPNIK